MLRPSTTALGCVDGFPPCPPLIPARKQVMKVFFIWKTVWNKHRKPVTGGWACVSRERSPKPRSGHPLQYEWGASCGRNLDTLRKMSIVTPPSGNTRARVPTYRQALEETSTVREDCAVNTWTLTSTYSSTLLGTSGVRQGCASNKVPCRLTLQGTPSVKKGTVHVTGTDASKPRRW